ncbi:hypothetical protein C1H46_006007 [Malus baccata]|uniref:Uncharacterized protein n=1 Tax=Malus baccata TaxID=106549 RepID=A0A540NBG3_MALBA|nr:hypothetical protein C1H46_006007 [Malus baccata]
MAKVPVAALRKWRVTLPSDPKELDEFNLEEYAKKGNFRIDSTPTLRFLNKASLGTSFAMTTLGMGNFISSFLLSTVSHITKKHGHKGWILNNLNASHLDYYYAFFAVLNVFNVIFFLFMTKMYVYKAEISDSIKVLTEELRETTYKASNEGDSRKGRITSEL